MSGKILPLSEAVRSKLRSGVNISTVAQCVEELVLNSIDAGATCIAIRYDPSIFRVQIVDNGLGITEDNLKLLGKRHATSKCYSLDDLKTNLSHYGFRGEALASLVEVAAIVDITTRPRGSTKTFTKMFTYGKEKSISVSKTVRPSVGTTITVQDFMYNMPVRRKLMKEAIDIENISVRLESFALMHPQISLSLRNDSTQSKVMHTNKSNSTLSTFMQLHGLERSQGMAEVEHSLDQFTVSGYISIQPHLTKGLQFVYVNKRVVLKTKIHKLMNYLLSRTSIISSKLHPTTPKPGKTPGSPPKGMKLHGIYIINIECPFKEYDICLDPSKTLVEFRDWDKLLLCIEEMVIKFSDEEGLTISLDERYMRSGKDQGLMQDEDQNIPHSSQARRLKAFSLKRTADNEDGAGPSREKYGRTLSIPDNLAGVHSLPVTRLKTKRKQISSTNGEESSNDEPMDEADEDLMEDCELPVRKLQNNKVNETDQPSSNFSPKNLLPLLREESDNVETSPRSMKIQSSLEVFRRFVNETDGEIRKNSISKTPPEPDGNKKEMKKLDISDKDNINQQETNISDDIKSRKLSSLEEFINTYNEDKDKTEFEICQTPKELIKQTPKHPPPLKNESPLAHSLEDALTQDTVSSQMETISSVDSVCKKSMSKTLTDGWKNETNKAKTLNLLQKFGFQKGSGQQVNSISSGRNMPSTVQKPQAVAVVRRKFHRHLTRNQKQNSSGQSQKGGSGPCSTNSNPEKDCEENNYKEPGDFESSFRFEPVLGLEVERTESPECCKEIRNDREVSYETCGNEGEIEDTVSEIENYSEVSSEICGNKGEIEDIVSELMALERVHNSDYGSERNQVNRDHCQVSEAQVYSHCENSGKNLFKKSDCESFKELSRKNTEDEDFSTCIASRHKSQEMANEKSQITSHQQMFQTTSTEPQQQKEAMQHPGNFLLGDISATQPFEVQESFGKNREVLGKEGGKQGHHVRAGQTKRGLLRKVLSALDSNKKFRETDTQNQSSCGSMNGNRTTLQEEAEVCSDQTSNNCRLPQEAIENPPKNVKTSELSDVDFSLGILSTEPRNVQDQMERTSVMSDYNVDKTTKSSILQTAAFQSGVEQVKGIPSVDPIQPAAQTPLMSNEARNPLSETLNFSELTLPSTAVTENESQNIATADTLPIRDLLGSPPPSISLVSTCESQMSSNNPLGNIVSNSNLTFNEGKPHEVESRQICEKLGESEVNSVEKNDDAKMSVEASFMESGDMKYCDSRIVPKSGYSLLEPDNETDECQLSSDTRLAENQSNDSTMCSEAERKIKEKKQNYNTECEEHLRTTWKEVTDETGKRVYVNLRTGNTSYEPPIIKETVEWTSSQPLGAPLMKIPVSEVYGRDTNPDFILTHGYSSFLSWKKKREMHSAEVNKSDKSNDRNITNVREKACLSGGTEEAGSSEISPGMKEAIQTLIQNSEEDMANDTIKWSEKPADFSEESENALSDVAQICQMWEAPAFAMDADILSSKVQMTSVDRGTNKTSSIKIYNIVHPYKFSKEMLCSCKVLGQLDKKFIACQITYTQDTSGSKAADILVLFDQHAVHERVRLETLIEENYETTEGGERVIRSTMISPPLEMTLPESEVRLMAAYTKVLLQWGLHFTQVSSSVVNFLSIPSILVAREPNELRQRRCQSATAIVESIVRDICYTLHQTGGIVSTIPTPLTHVLNSQACRGAIKFGDELSLEKCEELVKSLSECQLPFQCAHGRPSIVPVINLSHLAASNTKEKKPNLRKLREAIEADMLE